MVAEARAWSRQDYAGVDTAPSPSPPPLQRNVLSCQHASHGQHSAVTSTVSYLHKAQLKREQNALFQTNIEVACPEQCWQSAILFQRLTIFNLKSRQRPLKKSLDSIECDQIGYHLVSVIQTCVKLITQKMLRTLSWQKSTYNTRSSSSILTL